MRVEEKTMDAAAGGDGMGRRNFADIQVRAVGLCLEQLEREIRECGLHFSADLIRLASVSLKYGPRAK